MRCICSRPNHDFKDKTQPMKQAIFLLSLLCALTCAFAGPAASPPPSPFSPEAPEAAARELLQTYLPLLAAGDFEQAIPMNDLRGMRAYFLSRRLAELKAKNPELTQKDLEEMSAQIQMNDLNPLRLKAILLNVLKEGEYEGMTWSIQGYAAAPQGGGGYLVSIEAQTSDGRTKPILLKALVDDFWSQWQQGDLDKAYDLLGQTYRDRLPLLAFLQQAQEVIGEMGIPSSWSVVQSRIITPSVLGLGVEVTGSKSTLQTIMLFRKSGETWTLEEAQFRRPPAEDSPIPSQPLPDTAPRFRPDLQPDLKPPLPAPPHTPKSNPQKSNLP